MLSKIPLQIYLGPKQLFNALIFCLVGVLLCRGFMELIFPKSVAMVLQLFLTAMIFLALFYLSFDGILQKRAQNILVVGFLFLATACISGILTSLRMQFDYWMIYLLFNAFTVFIMFVTAQLSKSCPTSISFVKITCFWGMVLFLIALPEQMSLVKLPGASPLFILGLVRSASLTGSYLHYPIILSLLGVIVLQWALITRERKYFFVGICFWLAPFLAMSRSGMFISIISIVFYGVYKTTVALRKIILVNVRLILAGFFGVALFFLLLVYVFSNEDLINQQKLFFRLFWAWDIAAAGNRGRIDAWIWALQEWSHTNLFFGEKTGIVTLSTSQIFGEVEPQVAESGVLQQLLNFGAIGLILYYGLFVMMFRYIRSEHHLLRFGFLAALLQTSFYQSIEVIPFITLLTLFPWISQNYSFQQKFSNSPSYQFSSPSKEKLILQE